MLRDSSKSPTSFPKSISSYSFFISEFSPGNFITEKERWVSIFLISLKVKIIKLVQSLNLNFGLIRTRIDNKIVFKFNLDRWCMLSFNRNKNTLNRHKGTLDRHWVYI